MPELKALHDPKVLRAIAHPVRNRILDELSAHGSLRAADIARELDIPANQASFHLRQLAKYGLVEEDPAAARDKRDRVWRVAHEGGLSINFDDIASQPGGAAAADVFRHNATAWAQYLVRRAYEDERDERVHRSISDTALLLTKNEARELTDELHEVLDRWARRTRADDSTERRTYLHFSMLQPHPGRGEHDAPANES
ncbi:helix-turn-helix domain-containing protein [Kribbella sp. NBC_01245]|uniref:helix-turn-helix domain-containing protein n=1 Tax=Kribbella sp. NBC_01245 TaxID=2903578 RepID=UPI002E2E44C2|nr:helix-turn-helix domain-containing protein [Kribbella sp. NBC_01245]